MNSVEECRLALGSIYPIHCTSHVIQFFSQMDEDLTYQRFSLPTEIPWYCEVCGDEGQEGDGLTRPFQRQAGTRAGRIPGEGEGFSSLRLLGCAPEIRVILLGA